MKKSKKQPLTRLATRSASVLHDQAERLRAILETAMDGIITMDGHGIIESFNPAAEKILGYAASEVIGQNVSFLMTDPHREQYDGWLTNYQKTGGAKITSLRHEMLARKKDGTIFPIDLAVSSVQLTDRQLVTGFIRDLTERQRLEKEILEISEREQRRIGQDLHDGLCQHLAGMEMMSQVLAHKLAPKQKVFSKRATEITQGIRESIRQTRQLAHGLFPVTLEAEGLMPALAELAGNTEKIFQVRCGFVCARPVKLTDLTATTHLFRIAQEAVSNAIKHGRAKNITISLHKAPEEIRLSVSDDGCGFQKNGHPGSGMGLRLMQSRIGMIGGTIKITHNPGGGIKIVCRAPPKVDFHSSYGSPK